MKRLTYSLLLTITLPVFGIVIDGEKYDPTQDIVDVFLTKTNSWSNPPIYLASPDTMTKVGTTFSVADWIPHNLVDLYVQYLVTAGASSRGLLDGPGYLFNDQNGLLVGQSTNYTWKNPGYDNVATALSGGDSRLMGQYKLNDALNDTVVITTVGTNVGTSARNTADLTVSGKINAAFVFNGTSDKVDLGNNYQYTASSNFTISVWVYPTSIPKAYQAIVSKDASTYGWTILLKSNGKLATYFSAGGPNMDGVGTALQLNTWSHILLSYNITTSTIYINGVVDTVTSMVGSTFADEGQPCLIGAAHPVLGDRYFTGRIDDVRFYSAALSSNDMAQIYNAGNGTEAGAPAFTTSTNLMVLVATNKVVDFLPTSTWLTILTSGSSITTNDVRGYVSPDYGTNWYEASLIPQQSIDLSNTLFQGVAFYTNNVSASNLCLKAVVNSNKVVKVLGMFGPSN
jgi:hypothetical protein